MIGINRKLIMMRESPSKSVKTAKKVNIDYVENNEEFLTNNSSRFFSNRLLKRTVTDMAVLR